MERLYVIFVNIKVLIGCETRLQSIVVEKTGSFVRQADLIISEMKKYEYSIIRQKSNIKIRCSHNFYACKLI